MQRVYALSGERLAPGARRAEQAWTMLLHAVATDRVPHRPNRIDPRVQKRRPEAYPLMTRPRAELRAAAGR